MESVRSRAMALAVLCAGTLMIILDGSIVTVALPAMQRDLGFSDAGLTWVVNGYVVAFGGTLLLAGRLGDLLGRRSVFVAGIAVFTIASILCGIAPSPGVLVAARFAQGLGGALSSAVGLGMITTLFAEAGERTRALSAFAFTGAVGASLGQVLGGVLTDALSWHWIFLINLPLGVAAVLAALRYLPSEQGLGFKAGADVLGGALVTAGSMLGVYTIVQTEQNGWGTRTLALGVGALVLLGGFVLRQATASVPLMPLRVLRDQNVWGANLIQLVVLAALFSFQVMVTLYMQNVLRYNASETGLAMLPAAASIAVVSLFAAARLINQFGAKAVLVTGLVLLLAARLLLTRVPVDGHFAVDLLPLMILSGGFGLVMPSLTGLGMSGAKPADAGVVSGVFNTTQQIGAALGVAALSAVATANTAGTSREALTHGYHVAFWAGAGLLTLGIVLSLTVLRRSIPSSAEAPSPAPATENQLANAH
ncbi:MFS transporter [Actinomadura rupiterrae]|uniref:MFS transporter n=1 Tax=Actinomadura rupiterrae TaxID=559627 RepID=UPI0020A2356C|nr:MFS transporter [Actinomadura rupiterrae]MCP2337231.1 EmrB/QacA subfamily drug resistance transporter [Actinomadura rupiterrae]